MPDRFVHKRVTDGRHNKGQIQLQSYSAATTRSVASAPPGFTELRTQLDDVITTTNTALGDRNETKAATTTTTLGDRNVTKAATTTTALGDRRATKAATTTTALGDRNVTKAATTTTALGDRRETRTTSGVGKTGTTTEDKGAILKFQIPIQNRQPITRT